jgi:hypothetical protein
MSWTAPLRPIFRMGETLLDRVLCGLGAVAFAQLPEFIQQYRQRLGGHLDEARHQLAEYTAIATRAKLSLPQFIERTSTNSDTLVSQLGTVMRNVVLRVDELTTAEAALSHASLWQKPFVFIAHVDAGIARATWDVYLPAVPTTGEGLCYAVAGMITLLGLYHGLIRYPISAALSRRRRSLVNTPK